MHKTVGGKLGHYVRRLIHIAMFLIPIFYYRYGSSIASYMHLSVRELLAIIFLSVVLLEILRLHMGWLLLGQRKNEQRRVSAFAWGVISLVVVLLFVPGGYTQGIQYALPLIATLAFMDPLMGELRYYKCATWLVLVCGWLCAALIWLLACYYYQLSYYFLIILPVISVCAELPNSPWIDDNALVLWLPLLVVLGLHGWVA